MKSRYRIFAVLAIVVALLMAGGLLRLSGRTAIFCPLCWQDSLWMARRWVEAKLLLKGWEKEGASCVSNLFQIAIAILDNYVPKHDGFLPNQESWEKEVVEILKNLLILRCPDAKPSEKVSYRLNPKLSGKRLKDIRMPEKTVLIFESDEKGNPVARHHSAFHHGYRELFRHCCHAIFVDGRIGHLTASQARRLLLDR